MSALVVLSSYVETLDNLGEIINVITTMTKMIQLDGVTDEEKRIVCDLFLRLREKCPESEEVLRNLLQAVAVCGQSGKY